MKNFFGTYGRPILSVALLSLATLFIANATLDRIVQHTLLTHAEGKALQWADQFTQKVPDIELLTQRAEPTPAQLDQIQSTLAAGGIFRFVLFSPSGRSTLISDERLNVSEREPSINRTARAVFLTGETDVSINDGTAKANRPDAYVEAYVPAISTTGNSFGVIEVYVDVTELSNSLSGTLYWLSTVLIFGCAIIYIIPSLILVFRNDQVRKRDNELLRLSLSDPLTGVLNRGAFAEKSAEYFTKREEDERSIGLFFIDLDKFKEVNDTLGHDFGDQLLQHIARVLSANVRGDDLIGRVGGDEFVVVLPQITKAALAGVAERIIAEASEPFTCDGATVTPSLSIGMHLSHPGESESAAMRAADMAVYKAKADGRGRVCEYSVSLDDLLRRRRHIERCLNEGILLDRFYLEYQPIFDRDGILILGFEALLRLRDENGKTISPAEFIPIAEEAGLIGEIGFWSLRAALMETRDWDPSVYISVNLSAQQFRPGGLVGEVRTALIEAEFAPERLELEVTETLLLENEDSVGEQILELKALGISIALDDFGTGYSSLGYLWKYQFDKIKIDRVFLEGYDFVSSKYGDILETLVMLGNKLDVPVTVEGVETREQLNMLKELGCDQYQGFLLGKPMTGPQAQAKLDTQAVMRGGVESRNIVRTRVEAVELIDDNEERRAG